MACSTKGRKLLLELIDFRAHDVLAVIKNAKKGGFELRTDALLLKRKINKRDHLLVRS